jgi:hypothetical protein
MRTLLRFGVVAIGLILTLALFSRGTIGPESIVAKDVQLLIDASARSVNAIARGPDAIDPDRVPLPFELEAKRVLKTSYSSVDERAEAYLFEHGKLDRPVQCLIRLRGDHVIGVAIPQTAPQALKQALQAQFVDYEVVEFAPNLKLQRTPSAPLT